MHASYGVSLERAGVGRPAALESCSSSTFHDLSALFPARRARAGRALRLRETRALLLRAGASLRVRDSERGARRGLRARHAWLPRRLRSPRDGRGRVLRAPSLPPARRGPSCSRAALERAARAMDGARFRRERRRLGVLERGHPAFDGQRRHRAPRAPASRLRGACFVLRVRELAQPFRSRCAPQPRSRRALRAPGHPAVTRVHPRRSRASVRRTEGSSDRRAFFR